MIRPWTINQGDALETLRGMESASFDAVLCDPPYGLSFMGKAWDHGVPSVEVWAEVLRVLKPGAFLLAFGGTRTFHRLTCAIEDAGFEIRDCVSWLYGSGFPKSHNFKVDGFDGYGTALKPAWEPCIVAMKPLDGTFAENALRHGVAGINVEAGRVATTENLNGGAYAKDGTERHDGVENWRYKRDGGSGDFVQPSGRWPSNLILDAEAGAMLDEQSGFSKTKRIEKPSDCNSSGATPFDGMRGLRVARGYTDSGGASRFFYCAKASRRERDAGLDGFEEVRRTDGRAVDIENPRLRTTPRANHHPCLKPLDLNRYLASLILPPKRETPRRVLVPFSGSGSEMIGALMAGWDEAHGIEREAEYVAIAEARLAHHIAPPTPITEPAPVSVDAHPGGPLLELMEESA